MRGARVNALILQRLDLVVEAIFNQSEANAVLAREITLVVSVHFLARLCYKAEKMCVQVAVTARRLRIQLLRS